MHARTPSLFSLAALAALFASTAHAQAAPDGAAAPEVPAPQGYVAPQAYPPGAQPYYAPGAPPYQGAPPYAQPFYGSPNQPFYGHPNNFPRRERPIVGYREEERNPPAIWGTGLGLFLAGWVLNFAILTPIANATSLDRTEAAEQDAWAWSLIPIAGPFIQLGIEAPHPAIPIITGLLQIGGLVAFIVGLTQRETRRIPVRQGDPEERDLLRVDLDGGAIEGGGQVTLRVTH